jgi:hypothetical protein
MSVILVWGDRIRKGRAKGVIYGIGGELWGGEALLGTGALFL